MKKTVLALGVASLCFVLAALGQGANADDPAKVRAQAEARCKLAAQRYMRDGDATKSRAEFEEVAKIDPTFAMPLFFLGTLAEEQGKAAEAIGYYERFVALDSTSDYYVQAQLRLDELKASGGAPKDPVQTKPGPDAKGHGAGGQEVNADASAADAAKRSAALVREAEELVLAGNTGEAAAKFEEAFRRDPSNERTGLRAAMAYGAVKSFDASYLLLRQLSLSTDVETVQAASQGLRQLDLTHIDQSRLLQTAVMQGESWAAAAMGDLLLHALYPAFLWGEQPMRDIERNTDRTYKLYERAAAMGHARGLAGLGICYSQGFGVEKDAAKALSLLESAAAQGDLVGIAEAAYARKGSPDSNESTQSLRSLADEGYAPAQFLFAQIMGHPVINRPSLYIEYLQRASDQGYPLATYHLSNAYCNGRYVAKDEQRGIQLLHVAAANGLARAQADIALRYEQGMGVPRDDVQATHWYLLSAKQAEPDGQFMMAERYTAGTGVAVDLKEAEQLMRMVASPANINMWSIEARKWLQDRGLPWP